MLDMLAKGGTEAVGNTPKEAQDYLQVEIERWGKVIKQAKLRLE